MISTVEMWSEPRHLLHMAHLDGIDIDTLRSSIFFGSIPDAAFKPIVAQSRVLEIDADQTVFREGEPATAVFVVLSGLIKLTVGQRDGSEVLVEMFHAGTSFAEALAFGNELYPVSASGLVQSRVLAAPIPVVQRVLEAEPDAFKAILASTYRHLHALVRQIEELKGNSGLDRVARYILSRIDPEQGQVEIEIPFDKKVLALSLGIKPESLSRAFRRLNDHGVYVKGRKIQVGDVDALRSFLARNQD